MSHLYKVSEVKLSYKNKQDESNKIQIKSSLNGYKLLLDNWEKNQLEHKESFKVILLNRSNIVLGIYKISEGGIHETIVDVRLIFQAALLSNACYIIIAHNHPSGDLIPSHSDNIITQKVKEASKLMEIYLLDHLIITKQGYYSYADNGIV